MRALVLIFVLLFPVISHAGIITWEMGGPEWSGQATFHTKPPQFVSPSGDLHRYEQPIASGYSFEVTVGDYRLAQREIFRVQTLDRPAENQGWLDIDQTVGGMTDVYYQGDLVDTRHGLWGVNLRHGDGVRFLTETLPSSLTDEQLAAFGERRLSVFWPDFDLPTPQAPAAYELTYIGGAQISSIPEPSTWAMFVLGAVVLGFYWRKRTR